MRARRRSPQQGFTLFELVIAVVLGAGILAAAVQSSATADALATDTRIRLLATAKHRDNFRALAAILRAAAIETLDKFGPDDIATAPEFQRVTGMAGGFPTLDGVEKLVWQASVGPPVPGVKFPGAVHLVRPDLTRRIVAANVPKGTFQVKQEGRNLVVSLTTYYVVNGQTSHRIRSEHVVSLRN